MNEDREAADALGGILTSAMLRAYDGSLGPRRWLYCWERDGLRWLIRFQRRDPGASLNNAWIFAFLDLNKDAIISSSDKMDFNLRAHRLAVEVKTTK